MVTTTYARLSVTCVPIAGHTEDSLNRLRGNIISKNVPFLALLSTIEGPPAAFAYTTEAVRGLVAITDAILVGTASPRLEYLVAEILLSGVRPFVKIICVPAICPHFNEVR